MSNGFSCEAVICVLMGDRRTQAIPYGKRLLKPLKRERGKPVKVNSALGVLGREGSNVNKL